MVEGNIIIIGLKVWLVGFLSSIILIPIFLLLGFIFALKTTDIVSFFFGLQNWAILALIGLIIYVILVIGVMGFIAKHLWKWE